MLTFLRGEILLLQALPVGALAWFLEHDVMQAGQVYSLLAAALLVVSIACASMRVAHHAEILAAKAGDPYGTMILTLSAVLVEVIILVIMMRESQQPTLVRDTIYAAVMLDINGILGLAALLGGLKHGEQPYNDDSGKSYSVMIMTAMGISMVVPDFVPEASWHIYSTFTIAAMIALYALFLKLQVGQHSYFFAYRYPRMKKAVEGETAHAEETEGSTTTSVVTLIAGVAVIGLLAEFMAAFLNDGLEGTGAPLALTAILVAAIAAGPEILTAVRAALGNRMQAVVNIALGASLSTVILTVPVIEAIALVTGQPFIMAMTPVQITMVAITLVVAAININDGETNAIEGMTHFVLFATFIMLSILGL